MKCMIQPFEWGRMLIGEDHAFVYIFEVIFRTIIMFAMMVVFFRISGKSQIKQLNIYDLILIIGLGSAAGDPMFYDDVPLLHALFVFATVLSLYKLITWLSQRNHKAEVWLEGDVHCVMRENHINIQVLKKEGFPPEELFDSLRQARVSQLGQVDRIYLEPSGEFSIFFLEDDKVVPGLPLFPEELLEGKRHIDVAGTYSCIHCGYTKEYEQPTATPICDKCEGRSWVRSTSRKRIT